MARMNESMKRCSH